MIEYKKWPERCLAWTTEIWLKGDQDIIGHFSHWRIHALTELDLAIIDDD